MKCACGQTVPTEAEFRRHVQRIHHDPDWSSYLVR